MSEPDPSLYTKIDVYEKYILDRGPGEDIEYRWFYYDTGVKGHWFDDQLVMGIAVEMDGHIYGPMGVMYQQESVSRDRLDGRIIKSTVYPWNLDCEMLLEPDDVVIYQSPKNGEVTMEIWKWGPEAEQNGLANVPPNEMQGYKFNGQGVYSVTYMGKYVHHNRVPQVGRMNGHVIFLNDGVTDTRFEEFENTRIWIKVAKWYGEDASQNEHTQVISFHNLPFGKKADPVPPQPPQGYILNLNSPLINSRVSFTDM